VDESTTLVAPKRRASPKIAGALMVALLIVAGTYLGGRAVGHASVPGLQRQVSTLQRSIEARDIKLRARAKKIEADSYKLRSLQFDLDDEHKNSNMCRLTVDDADKAFTSLLELLSFFPGTTDPQIIAPYMNQLFDDIDEYHLMRRGCTNLRAQA
jgi:hypothetical protein